MPLLFSKPTACCGCGACEAVCPKGAITMQMHDGFWYPQIHAQLCVECGLCKKVCAFQQEKQKPSNCLEAYGGRADAEIRRKSSSGGIFPVLSDRILEEGGVVYGAAFDENMHLRHIRAETREQRDRMRGSKYIQSDTSGVFPKVKEDLEAGKAVLFTGTPCQVAGLRGFLRKEYPNLICVDLICHGVPSPKIWEDFTAYLEDRYKSPVVNYAFRNKAVSWRQYSPVVTLADQRVIPANDHTGSFIELFRYDVCMRPACTACPYASMHRQGDITLGDFWGIEDIYPELDDGLGVSAIMVNSEKGKTLLEACKERLTLHPCTQDQIGIRQPNLYRPSRPSNKAEAFGADKDRMPFSDLLKKYTRVGAKRRMIDGIKRLLHRQ